MTHPDLKFHTLYYGNHTYEFKEGLVLEWHGDHYWSNDFDFFVDETNCLKCIASECAEHIDFLWEEYVLSNDPMSEKAKQLGKHLKSITTRRVDAVV